MERALTTKNTRALATTDDLVDLWLAQERADDRSEATLDTYRRGLLVFQQWMADQGRERVTPATVRRYKEDLRKQYSAQTVNLRLAALRSYCRFLVTTGRAAHNPAAEVTGAKRPKSRVHKRDALANGEVLDTLDTCDPRTLAGIRDRAILMLMAYCGLRQVEIHRLDIGHIKTTDGRMVLEIQGKGHSEADDIAVVPVDQEAVIRDWLKQRRHLPKHGARAPLFVSLSRRNYAERLGLRAIRGMVVGRMRAAGVVGAGERKSTHSLRHSAITAAIRGGAAPMQVQALARHASFDTTLSYVHQVQRTESPAEDLIRYDGTG